MLNRTVQYWLHTTLARWYAVRASSAVRGATHIFFLSRCRCRYAWELREHVYENTSETTENGTTGAHGVSTWEGREGVIDVAATQQYSTYHAMDASENIVVLRVRGTYGVLDGRYLL